jgi:hypothetical protein
MIQYHPDFGFIDMKRIIHFGLLMLSLLVLSCKEVYSPDISNTQKILVVDGLISDEPKVFTIRLSTALPFDSTGYVPETGAVVYVTDTNGNRFDFSDQGSGNYRSDSASFIPVVGSTYTLNIETKNKKVYKSTAQELLPKGTLSEVLNNAKTKPFYLTVEGDLRSTNVIGADFIASFNFTSEKNPYYRFSNTVFLEYIRYYSFRPDHFIYCWQKYNPNEFFNINDNPYSNSGQFDHDLGFLPFDTSFYSIVKERVVRDGNPPFVYYIYNNIFQFIVSFRQYHLNEDVFRYYQLLNKQLEAKQRILDPVAFQISGNISCVSDPGEKVFGMFEASSSNLLTYIVDRNLRSASYRLKPIRFDLDSIADSGTYDSIPPPFWIY